MLQDHLPIDSFDAKAGAPYVPQHSVPVFLDVEGPTGNVCNAHNDLSSPVGTETCSAEVTPLAELPAAVEEDLVADAAGDLAEDGTDLAVEALETAVSDCLIAPEPSQLTDPPHSFLPVCDETCQQDMPVPEGAQLMPSNCSLPPAPAAPQVCEADVRTSQLEDASEWHGNDILPDLDKRHTDFVNATAHTAPSSHAAVPRPCCTYMDTVQGLIFSCYNISLRYVVPVLLKHSLAVCQYIPHDYALPCRAVMWVFLLLGSSHVTPCLISGAYLC